MLEEGDRKVGPIWVMGEEVVVGHEPIVVKGPTLLSEHRADGADGGAAARDADGGSKHGSPDHWVKL